MTRKEAIEHVEQAQKHLVAAAYTMTPGRDLRVQQAIAEALVVIAGAMTEGGYTQ